MKLIALAILGVSLVLSLVLTYVARRLAPRFGLVDQPNARKVHETPIPLGGGIAILCAVAVPVLLGMAISCVVASGWTPSWLPVELAAEADKIVAKAGIVLMVIGGALCMALLGLVDDLKGLSPVVKLIVQIAIASCLALHSIRITIFIENPVACGVITVLWVVGVTNAFNLLDNMDGLSAGVALIVSAIFLVVAVQTHQLFVASLLLTLIGALVGFLVFNFHPASIFMGDSGSLLVGYLLGVLTVVFTFYKESHPLFPVIVPLLIMAIPLFDTVTVVAIRLRRGLSPFQADKNHLSHRLVALGMSTREAVLSIYLVTFCVGVAATLLYHTTTVGTVILFIQALAILFVVLLLERAGRRSD